MTNTVAHWADAFVNRLAAAADVPGATSDDDNQIARIVERAADPRRVYLLLDYDGTLVPIAGAPEEALPDRALIELLDDLSQSPNVEVHIVSGRPPDFLDTWFGHLPLTLWAEHGFWARTTGSTAWEAAGRALPELLDRVDPILKQFTANTPGARIERKTASLAWHYRQADPAFGERQAHELRLLLGDVLSNQPLEVVEGNKVVEIRFRGFSKALVALRTRFQTGSLTIAFGDDRSDDDLFRALPHDAVTVGVGPGTPPARFRLCGSDDVRALLRAIVLTRRIRPTMPTYA
jgi:trehalose 6-phosphate synthase/phosphatase